jgi:dTDP-4-dehydrorhamnose 3,5-epimerase-like enzyme
MEIRTRKNKRFQTKDRHAKSNGFLVPIFNVHDGFVAPAQHPQQAYLTVVAPGTAKGPHLHMKRWGLFTCIRGNVKIVVKNGDRYEEHLSGEDHDFATVQLPAGLPAALVNLGTEDAYVLNMPAPSWHVDDQDDHPVTDWDYPLP